jgi:hypothetical protein
MNQDEKPRASSIAWFESSITTHKRVLSCDRQDEYVYRIARHDGDDIVVYLTNIYTVAIADVTEILSEHPEVNCILTISAWNGYTQRARAYAADQKVGLFIPSEFWGALWMEDFWAYVKRDKDGNAVTAARPE